ncbi:hypothetical protein BDB01DRAFT_795089 [Pilobolus umbonatus]|nr:hypothetical protein BDB01DRAFT_795089 [Pilobolus umbonatus]
MNVPTASFSTAESQFNSNSFTPIPNTTLSSESNDTDKTSTPRKRTRASSDQLSILEKSFNNNPSPNSRVREHLSRQLGMSERSIQIWFQNRRAKVKNIAKKTSILHEETIRLQQYASAAAAAACQAAAFSQQRQSPNANIEDPIKTNPDLYYYYYYYYFNEQQQKQKYGSFPSTSPVPPPPPIPLKTMPPPPPLLPPSVDSTSISDSWTKKYHPYGGRVRAHTIGPYPVHNTSTLSNVDYYQRSRLLYDRGASAELSNMNRSGLSPHITTNIYNYIPNTTMTPIPFNMNTPFSNKSTQDTMDTTTSISTNSTHHENDTNNSTSGDNNKNTLVTSNTLKNDSIDANADMNTMYTNDYLDQTSFTGWPDIVNSNTSSLFKQVYLSSEALQIGSWKRLSFNTGDLCCSFDKERRVFIWCIQDGTQRFKMEFHEESVESIQFLPSKHIDKLRLEMKVLCHLISFYMELGTPDNWIQCRDYTEDKQASTVCLHELEGSSMALKAEIELLVQESDYLQSRYLN